jgi:hypothetical protein
MSALAIDTLLAERGAALNRPRREAVSHAMPTVRGIDNNTLVPDRGATLDRPRREAAIQTVPGMRGVIRIEKNTLPPECAAATLASYAPADAEVIRIDNNTPLPERREAPVQAAGMRGVIRIDNKTLLPDRGAVKVVTEGGA